LGQQRLAGLGPGGNTGKEERAARERQAKAVGCRLRAELGRKLKREKKSFSFSFSNFSKYFSNKF
jgi:hypothetical protein